MPLFVVAQNQNLGHADTRMVEKHYGHLAPSYVANQVQLFAPRFGIIEDNSVTPLAGGIVKLHTCVRPSLSWTLSASSGKSSHPE
jgi:hypothetical protein